VKEIRYRATYSEGEEEIIAVRARTINSGFGKALRRALEPLGNGTRRELARLEFWIIP
jgi:hypothetical protein